LFCESNNKLNKQGVSMTPEKVFKLAKMVAKRLPSEVATMVDIFIGYALNIVFGAISKAVKGAPFTSVSAEVRQKMVAYIIVDCNKYIAPLREILTGEKTEFDATFLAREIKAIEKDQSIKARVVSEGNQKKVQIAVGYEVQGEENKELEKLMKKASLSKTAKA
jgi:hypothetical protein|tara:strand:+ start:113 stop:604 length:492 start_codon:yes stop_codon:yes gene_type:complete